MPNIKEFDEWYAGFVKANEGMVYSEENMALEAFEAGYALSQSQPANTVEVKAGQVLSRNERDALVAANVFLATLQRGEDGSYFFYRVQKVVSTISDILYGDK